MALSIYNTVQSASLAESPIVVRVDDDAANITSGSYQFVADLYSWRGDEVADKPTSPTYTFSKFPIINSLGNGNQLFDFSPYLNSQLSQSLAFEYTYNVTYPRWYSIEMYAKWVDNNVEYTSSHEDVNGGVASIATQGYNLWGERNNALQAPNKELSGETAFSESIENYPILSTVPSGSTLQIYRTDVPFFFATYNRQDAVSGSASTQPIINNVIAQTVGAPASETYDPFQFYSTGSFSVISPMEVKPSDFESPGIGDGTGFYLRARDSGNTEFGGKVNVSYDNCSKYTPVRIAFKNRYGAFDQFDAPLVSRTTFNAQTKQYKTPSISTTLPRYDAFKYNETYFSEGGETITVNTDYVDEVFNEYFKGMLVSDEIYIVEPDNTLFGFQATLKPLVIKSSSTQLKKGEVDKLIQYTFTFQVSTPYKLVL
jgi:hypothetical protein